LPVALAAGNAGEPASIRSLEWGLIVIANHA
jgi:hypothetical protein